MDRWPRWTSLLISFLAALLLVLGSGLPSPLSAQPTPTNPAAGASPEGDESPSLVEPAPPLIPIDVDRYWAGDCIKGLAQMGIVAPNDQGLFLPEDPITWAEFTGVLNLVFPTGQAGGWANPLEQALGLSVSGSVASQYPTHYYQPDRAIVREEAVMALAAKLNLSYVTPANGLLITSLEDANKISDYAREGVAAALQAGVIVAYPNPHQLLPLQRFSRGEAAALICQASRQPGLQSLISQDWVVQAQLPESVPVPDQELRGVWLTNIDSQVLFSQENLTMAVDKLSELNFNTLYPTVWNWGYTLYPSATAARELGASQHLYGEGSTPQRESAQADRDMLKELIELAHAKNLKVIPWFEFGFMAPDNYVLYQRHPDWFTQQAEVETEPAPLSPADPDQAPDVGGIQTTTAPADPGIWLEGGVLPRRWLNPFHPQAQKFILELVNDLVSNYEVDGFQMDDHLGLPVEFGYDPYTINLYKADHNGQAPPSNPRDQEWLRWRADKISDFLAGLNQLVKSRRPQAVVSISPNPYPFAYVNYLQNWPDWVKRDLVDELVIQLYRDDQNRFIWEMNKPEAQAARRKIPTSIGILSGLRAAPVSINQIADQIVATRDRSFAGMSFFFYESLWIAPRTESVDHRIEGLQRAFPAPIERPG